MKKFIVAGIQRTGTTLIRTSIDSHPAMRCVGEAFKVRTRRGGSYRGDQGYAAYLSGAVSRRLGHYLWRGRVVRDYLDSLYSLEGFDAVGFKMMLSHTRQFPMVVPYILEHDVSVVHVVRRNVLKTLVSVTTARARGAHHSTKKVGVTQVAIATDGLVTRLQAIENNGNRWAGIFQHKVPYLRVDYETFVENRERESAAIQAFLGVAPDNLESSLVKLNPDDLSRVITNFDDVQRCLSDSPFAWCVA